MDPQYNVTYPSEVNLQLKQVIQNQQTKEKQEAQNLSLNIAPELYADKER